ncbi:alpha/beta fold hydrolase [Streptosporangium sp. NPDC000396]|uniref:alpha/beta fold hydrolase n=1 Tax=Streptosporangium sp. NPDC000396 TaxID=3366185 RepID=UPI0036A4C4C0
MTRPSTGARARRRITGLLGALAMTTVLAAVPPPAQAATASCAQATERCDGTLEVPLDPANPAGEKLSIAYTWVPAKDRTRQATGTVLVLPGGPAPSLWAVENTRAWLGPALDHQNLLMLDQRGWGGSSALSCPGLDVTAPETVRRCATTLGERARFFGTAYATHDIEALRAELGVPALTVYGYSWGTLIGQAYAVRHPDRTRAVLLDSVLSAGRDGYADMAFSSAARRGAADIGAVCRPSAQCRKLPGTPAGRWAKLVARLRSHPDAQVTAGDLARLTGNLADPFVGRQANAAADAYLRGDASPLRRLVTQFPTPPAMPSDPAMLAFVCADSALPYDRRAGLDERRAQLARHRAGMPARPYTTAEALGAGGEAADWCLEWPTREDAPPLPGTARYPRVPALAIGGQLDAATPPGGAIQAARRFGGTALTVPFGAHVGASFGQSEVHTCLRSAVRSFLAAPGPVADGRCSAENYRALGRFPRASQDLRPARAEGLDAERRRLLAAAFATVDDAVARSNPNGMPATGDTSVAGLRGGRIDHGAGVVRLTGDRFLSDLAVSGEIRLNAAGRASATLDVTRDRSTAKIVIVWTPFQAADSAAVSGTFDGVAFDGTVPRH